MADKQQIRTVVGLQKVALQKTNSWHQYLNDHQRIIQWKLEVMANVDTEFEINSLLDKMQQLKTPFIRLVDQEDKWGVVNEPGRYKVLIRDLAEEMQVPVNDLILFLMTEGVLQWDEKATPLTMKLNPEVVPRAKELVLEKMSTKVRDFIKNER